eukprot:13677587-Alexandrium_andersonii.AAC.1
MAPKKPKPPPKAKANGPAKDSAAEPSPKPTPKAAPKAPSAKPKAERAPKKKKEGAADKGEQVAPIRAGKQARLRFDARDGVEPGSDVAS